MTQTSKYYVAYVTFTWEPDDQIYRQAKLILKDCSDKAEAKAAIDAWASRLNHKKEKLLRNNVEVLHLTSYENGRFGEPLPDDVLKIGISEFYDQEINRSGVPMFGGKAESYCGTDRTGFSSSNKDFMTDAVIEQLGGVVAL